MDARVEREQQAYDQGEVFQNSLQLQTRFRHVFFCPNTKWLLGYVDEIIARKAPGGVVLDYGCFTGDLYQQLAPHQPLRIVGIDISTQGIETARARFGSGAEYLVMDAHRTSFEGGTFDLVVRSILHHLEMRQAVLSWVKSS